MVEDAQFHDLTSTVHRLEAKVDVALTHTQARVEEHGRLLAGTTRELDGLDTRMRVLEADRSGGFARLAAVEHALNALTDRVTGYRPSQWPGVVAAVVVAVGLVLNVAATIYSK